jgi:ribosomal protein S19
MKRSKWKGPFLRKLDFAKKLHQLPRNYEITSKFVGLMYLVHSGKMFIKLNITDEMIGHKVGEFVSTRERFVFKKKKKKK